MLQKAANISTRSVAKLGRNENVNTDTLVKICEALECDISEIMEIIPEEQPLPAADDIDNPLLPQKKRARKHNGKRNIQMEPFSPNSTAVFSQQRV